MNQNKVIRNQLSRTLPKSFIGKRLQFTSALIEVKSIFPKKNFISKLWQGKFCKNFSPKIIFLEVQYLSSCENFVLPSSSFVANSLQLIKQSSFLNFSANEI